MHAQVWATALDQDGAEPHERDIARRRGLTLGHARNGVIPVRGDLLPDVAAQLQRICDATYTRPAGVQFTGDGSDDEPNDVRPKTTRGARFAAILDDRTRPQRLHDALALALGVAARSGDLPTIGGAAPTLIVMGRAEDLAADTGWATIEGCDEPVSPAVARHVGCAGVIQRVTLARERPDRPARHRGTPLQPAPAPRVRAPRRRLHHPRLPRTRGMVRGAPRHRPRQGGPTHTDNGVLLCWAHHRFIDTGPWRIRMNHGVPEVQAPLWLDPTGRWRPVTKSRIRMLEHIGRRT